MDLSALPPIRDLPFPLLNKIAIIIINFTVGLLVLTVVNHTSSRSKSEKLFLLMSLSMLAWVDGAYLARIFGNTSYLALPLLRFAWFATPFLFYLTYLTSVHFLKREGKFNKFSLILLVAVVIIASIAAVTPWVVEGYKFTNGILDIVYGPAFYPYLIITLVTIAGTVLSMWKTKLSNAVKAFLLGVIIFYVLNAIFNITLPVFLHITNLYFIGDYSTVFLLGATTYAILRHKLFDIKVFATEVLTVMIWVILLVRIFLYPGSVDQSFVDIGVFLLSVFFGVLVIRSVNVEVKQKEELSRLTKELKSIDAKKDEFINMAAHELRAPLTAIKGFISMVISGDTGAVSKQTKEFLQDSAVSTERMIRLVNNMLNVSRIEEGRLTYQAEIFPLSKAATEVYSEFQVEAERKSLEFSIDIQAKVTDLVYVDADKLHEVIVNFVSNAIKYTEKGFIKIKVLNTVPNIVRLEVVDSGNGISPEEQKRLFQKFYRVEAKVGKTIGTGLGLYISKLLIQKFGGRIGVNSATGKGSTFWFELPVRKA